jgi:hypothetical protein
MFVLNKGFMDMVYVAPLLAVVAATAGLHVPAREGATRLWEWRRRWVPVVVTLYLGLGVVQNARYTAWIMRADIAPLEELWAVLRKVVPRDAKILAIDTLWPAFYDYPVFYAAHAPIETLGLSDDLASGRLGPRRYDVLIIDDFWLASRASTTPILLQRFEASRDGPPVSAVLYNTRYGDVRIYRLNRPGAPSLPDPLRLYFAGDRPGVFELGARVVTYEPDDIVAVGVPEVPGARISRTQDGVRILTDRSNYHYQLSLPIVLERDRAYAVRVTLKVESGGASVGVENGGRWVVAPVRMGAGSGFMVRDLGGFLHSGGQSRVIISNDVHGSPDESQIILSSVELWELEPVVIRDWPSARSSNRS